ncbi:MAG: glycosyltransferase family 4 protein [SAR202 cluster bacterium]|nr:glycosyltransferase family 4 protein [SAR202 cluster bacterium]
MDILITVGIFPPDIGGPASFVPKIAKYLINKGHNVKIICLSDKEHLTYKDDINVIRINRSSPIIFRWLKTIVKIYSNSKKSDLIFVNGLGTETTIANLFIRKKVIRKIVGDPVWERVYNKNLIDESFDDFQENNHGLSISLQKMIRNWSINKSNLIITPSQHLKNFIDKIGFDKNIFVINNGVNIEQHNKVVLENNIIQLLVVSRLVSQKNIDLIIKAVKVMENENIILNIVGDGSEINNLKLLVKKYELDKKINFIGKIENTKLNEYLKNADIFIQASNYEGLPHSILEAMNFEIPILSTDVGGCSVLLNKGERGYIIPMPVSEVEISEGIRKIINNKNEAKSKARLAKNYLNQEHNFNTNAEIYDEKIKEVVKSQ